MVRVFLGILKGAIIGGALGYGAMKLHLAGGPLAFVVYAAVGFLVGLVCGKAIWRQETLWTPALKGIVGALICTGLYWGATKLLGGLHVALPAQLGASPDQPVVSVPLVMAPLLAIVYGVFVELDDGGDSKAAAAAPARRG